MPVLSFYYFIS